MKQKKVKIKTSEVREMPEFRLPGEVIIAGPGTVPISTASISQTSIKDMVAGLRRASRLGLFDAG